MRVNLRGFAVIPRMVQTREPKRGIRTLRPEFFKYSSSPPKKLSSNGIEKNSVFGRRLGQFKV